MKQLVNKTLWNKDIAVVRIVLMILNELVCELNIIGKDSKLFESFKKKKIIYNHRTHFRKM